jgi:CBS-domain-containing membrane protein
MSGPQNLEFSMKKSASNSVADLMTKSPTTVRPGMTLQDAAHLLWTEELVCLPVVDESETCVGVLTDRDIAMCAYTQGQPLWHLHVDLAMAKHVISAGPDESIEDVAHRMKNLGVSRLPVVDENQKLLGIITKSSLARASTRSEHNAVLEATLMKTPEAAQLRVATPKNGSAGSPTQQS